MQFRFYIQALRAISIISVLLFHFYTILPLGYLGVDLFFIISGFLVGGKIVSDVKNSTFSSDFFKKRIFRILPNQIFYISILLIIVILKNYPTEISQPIYLEIKKATLLLSNIHYWGMSGYFDRENIYKPLLHLWSLSLEEQYYILFPSFILIIKYIFKKIDFFVIMVFFLSFFLSTTNIGNAAKFYLLPFRIWEFLIGTIIYLYGKKSLYTLLFTLPLTLFSTNPTDNLIIISLGIIFYLLEAHKEKIDIYFSNKMIQFFGNISYSLYLSHWIVFFLINASFPNSDKISLFIAYITLSVGVSIFTYNFIETRIVYLKPPYQNGKSFVKLSIPLILMLFINFISNHSEKFQYRIFDPKYISTNTTPTKLTITDTSIKLFTPGSAMSITKYHTDNSKPTILIWGDSHCGNLNWNRSNLPFNVVSISVAGCPPLWNTYRNEPKGGNNCNCESPKDRDMIKKFMATINYDAVVLISRWNIYIEGWQKDGKLQTNTHFIVDSVNSNTCYDARISLFKKSVNETTQFFNSQNKKVIIIQQLPDISEYGDAKSLYWKGIHCVKYKPHKSQATTNRIFQELDCNKIKTIELSKTLLDLQGNLTIWNTKQNSLLYYDDNHLNQEGRAIVTTGLIDSIMTKSLLK